MAESAVSQEFEQLLAYLRDNRGFDFTGYKRASLKRRIDRRMQAVGVEGYTAYLDFLKVHPHEFTALFNTILINVTEFFRNPEMWQYLRDEVLPRLLEATPAGQPVRVWSAGCASGEEPYAVAMLLTELLGPEVVADRAKIYATDVDEEALEQARRAVYSETALEPVPAELRDRYFTANHNGGEGRMVRADVRRALIFGRHDLLKDAPISHTDLLLCRNTLMYFNSETQRRILQRLHFAVNEPGYLVLGQIEMLLGSRDLFQPVEGTHRVFAKASPSPLRQRLGGLAERGGAEVVEQSTTGFADEAFEHASVPLLVVDATDLLASANARARQLFGLQVNDLQRPFQDLSMSYRPVELRSLIEQARAEGGLAALRDVEWTLPEGETRYYEIEVVPIGDTGEVLFTVFDVTSDRALRQELESSNRELEEAYEELQSTNEELETTNEELQSTVEELETTNEELHSTNEQLHAINSELENRTAELNDVNSFLESIISSFEGGVIVLDTDLNVRLWSDRVVELWGLRSDEVEGGSFFGLDIGLPTEELAPAVRGCAKGIDSRRSLTLTATDRRGRTFECAISCVPLTGAEETVRGAILVVQPRTEFAWQDQG